MFDNNINNQEKRTNYKQIRNNFMIKKKLEKNATLQHPYKNNKK